MVAKTVRGTTVYRGSSCRRNLYNGVRSCCYVCILIIVLLQFKNVQYWMLTSQVRQPIKQATSKTKAIESKQTQSVKKDINKMIHNIIEMNGASQNNQSFLGQVHDEHIGGIDASMGHGTNASKPIRENSLMKAESMKWGRSPMLVLFSSWAYTKEKYTVHKKVLRLWSSWSKDSVRPVVYSSNVKVNKIATASGWHVRTISKSKEHVNRECYGPPVLRALFTDAFENFRSFLYGYANADIVFGDGLEKTLRFIKKNYLWHSRPVLIVGRRHNFDFTQNTFQLDTPSDVKPLTKRGQLVARSTDYFFTNILFPWDKVPAVSIGRPFVVRAVIGFAIKEKIDIIDATKTIEAVHLTTTDGAYASFNIEKGVNCNRDLLKNDTSQIPLRLGHCECVALETDSDNEGIVFIKSRDPDRNICKR